MSTPRKLPPVPEVPTGGKKSGQAAADRMATADGTPAPRAENGLAPERAARSLQIAPGDADGRQRPPGSEVRVTDAASGRGPGWLAVPRS